MNLAEFAVRWGGVAEKNQQSLGSAWSIADEFFRLHVLAADSLSKRVLSDPSSSNQAASLLLCHGLNLFSEAMCLLARGMFDVSIYLMRGLFDVHSILYASLRDETYAERWLNGGLKASEARKFLVSRQTLQDDELGQALQDVLKRESDIANQLSHVGTVHAGLVISADGGVLTVLGQENELEAIQQARSALYLEELILSWILVFRASDMRPDWTMQLEDVRLKNRDYRIFNSERLSGLTQHGRYGQSGTTNKEA